NGQQLSLAVEVAKAFKDHGPTVEKAVEEHISLLNRVGEDTRAGYRLRARDHINPHIGGLRVHHLTWQRAMATSPTRTGHDDAVEHDTAVPTAVGDLGAVVRVPAGHRLPLPGVVLVDGS